MGGQFSRQKPAEAVPPPAEITTLFQPGELRDYAGFVGRSVRRRWKLAAAILVLFVAATAAVTWLLPRRYHVEGRLFAMPVEGTPGAVRSATGEPTGLAQGAAEVILTHQNLVALMAELDLPARWEAARPPLLRSWDQLKHALGAKELDKEARDRVLIGYLQKRLVVQAKGPDVIISFDWAEPRTAFEVVGSSQKKFLVVRRAAELIPLERKVSTIEASAALAQRRIDELVERIDEAARAKRVGARSSTVRGLQAEGRFRDLPDQRLARQRMQIISRRKAVAELEDVRRKRLSELNATLAEQRAVLGPGNPAVLDSEDKIRSLERDDAAVEALKTEEQRLLAEFVRDGGKEVELASEPAQIWPAELKDDEEPIAYGKARIAMELSNLQHLLGQAAEAQVVLASARASFDSRYMVVIPAEEPDEPVAPKTGLLLLAGLLGGALLAVLGAVTANLRGSAIRESWQVERQLDLPVLAEVREP
jgi:uncharacterized protein involved in exopolysaccharide biosynthesis